MTHLFRGKRYKIVEPESITLDGEAMVGSCSDPAKPASRRVLACKLGQDEAEELDTWVHEAIHATQWDLREAAVEEIAQGIAGLLWKLGYRRTK